MDKFIGTMLDNRYELLEVIGVGGTAVVYKAKCHRLNRYVAVKILKDAYASDEEFRRKFHDEAQAVAMLSHPNIVNVYDVSRSGNIEYIVMELIDGITLKEYLSRRGQLSPKEVAVFTTQIARALEHAHDHNIIHRDIKPQNIMLLRDGTVKVADFGIAHFAARETTYNKGEAIGSVHYVSPEQAKGSHVDNRADLYSLGVVMYEMITGRLPFEGDSPVSIALQHINSIAVSPSVFAENVSPMLEEMTMKAMNPVLSKRYASAGQLLRDLEAFQNEQQFRLNISREECPIMDDGENDLDATRKLNNTGEVAALLEAENRNAVQNRPEQLERSILEEEEAMPKQKKKKTPLSGALIFSILAIVVFCVGAAAFVNAVLNPFDREDDSRLSAPPLVGEYFSQVVGDSKYADVEIVEGEYVYNETVDAGKIIQQSPEAGHKMEKGGKITVTISRGAKTFHLPKYVNQEARQVKIELERLGIVCVENPPEFDDEVQNGYVLRTDPGEGAELTAGDTVTLTVSKGPEVVLVDMPDLMGCSEAEALTRLEAAGLEWEDPTYEEYEGTSGQVIRQSIEKGTQVEKGSVVTFVLSKEPERPPEVTVPYRIFLIESVDLIQVEVLMDGKTVDSSTHNSSEISYSISISAPAGQHHMQVYQNGELTADEWVTL